MSVNLTKINLSQLQNETFIERSAYEEIISNNKQSAIDAFDYLLKKYTNVTSSYVLELGLILGDYGPDSLGYYRFSDYPESGFNPASLGFTDTPIMCRVRTASSALVDVGDEITLDITFYFSNSSSDTVSVVLSIRKTSSEEYSSQVVIYFGAYFYAPDGYFKAIPNVLDLSLLTAFFTPICELFDKYEVGEIIPSTLALSYYPPYSNTLLTDVFTNHKSLIHRNLSYSIRVPTGLFFVDDNALEQPLLNRFDYDINFSGTNGSINKTIPFDAVDFIGVSIDELIFSVASRYITYISQDTDFYNYSLPQVTQSALPTYNSIDDFLPDFFNYLEFFIDCCNEKGADEMDYTSQLESIANSLSRIDNRLHVVAEVEGIETDVNITEALIDVTESLEDTINRPIINTNEDLSPWSAV